MGPHRRVKEQWKHIRLSEPFLFHSSSIRVSIIILSTPLSPIPPSCLILHTPRTFLFTLLPRTMEHDNAGMDYLKVDHPQPTSSDPTMQDPLPVPRERSGSDSPKAYVDSKTSNLVMIMMK